MTFLGCIFIPLGLVTWILKPALLLPLAVIAAVFHAGSVLNIGDFGLPPYYFIAILIAFRWLALIVKDGLRIRKLSPLLFPLCTFWIWTVVGALIMPHLFAGTPVLRIEGGIEAITLPAVPLAWSYRNVIQAVWLTLNVSIVLYAEQHLDAQVIQKAYIVAAICATVVVAAEVLLFGFGIRLPLWLFHSNPGYAQMVPGYLGIYRPSGLFTEPSIEGVLFAGITLAALARFLKGEASIWPLFAAVTLVLIIQSAGLYAAAGVGALVMGLAYGPIRRFRYMNVTVLSRWAALAVIFLLAAFIFSILPSTAEAVAANSINKANTDSFMMRTAADRACLRYFTETYGLGVGIGSARGSSLISTLLATTGMGVLLLCWFFARLVTRACTSLRWLFIGGLLAMIFAVPDLSLPTLWANVLLVMSTKPRAPNKCITADYDHKSISAPHK